MRRIIWVSLVTLVTLVTSCLLLSGHLPLGIRAQWEWGRIGQATPWVDFLTVGLVATSYVAAVGLASRFVAGSAWVRRVALCGLVAAGFVVQMVVQQVGFGLAKWPFVLVDPSSSGYYTAARRDVRSAVDYLAHYDQIQAEYHTQYGPLHLATHPPGLVLLHYGALEVCELNPSFTRFLLSLQPRSVENGFRAVAATATISPVDRASIWLVAILSQLASALVVIPIFNLARRGAGPEAAWLAAGFWPLVPAVTVFMPKSDVLYPLFAASCVALVLGGRTSVGRLLCPLAGGVVLCMGMFLTFGLISVFPLAVLAAAIGEGVPSAATIRLSAKRATGLLAGFLAAQFFWLLSGHNLAATWWRCYRIHATFYDVGQIGANRTYWPWVGFNLIEFAFAVGIPLILAAIAGTYGLVRSAKRPESDADGTATASEQNTKGPFQFAGVAAACWMTLLLLDMSGKNLGEIARLWMFLMPFAAVVAAATFERMKISRWPVIVLLAAQAIQAVVSAASVQGFYDPQSVPF